MHPDILPLTAAIEADHWWFVARRQIVRELLERVTPPGGNVRVLDLGCGTGGNVGSLAGSYTCHGVDSDPEAVRFASQRYPECQFECASIFEPWRWGLRGPVDVCLLMDVIEHLDDDRTAIQNAVVALRPGGHLLVTVPADPKLWGKHDRHHGHRRRYTRTSLDQLLGDFPLQSLLLSYFNSRLYYPILIFRSLQNQLGGLDAWGTTGDLRRQPALVNSLLKRLFLGESKRLRAALEEPNRVYARGVSLIALYEREAV